MRRGTAGMAGALLALLPIGSGVPAGQNQVAEVVPADGEVQDAFGAAVSIAGDTALVGNPIDSHEPGLFGPLATKEGSAYVHVRSAGSIDVWGQVAKLTAGLPQEDALFGQAVAIDGDTGVVGAPLEDHSGGLNSGAVYVFERDLGGGNAWGEATRLVGSDPATEHFGDAVSLSGDTLVVGAPQTDLWGKQAVGYVSVRERNAGGPGAWGEAAVLSPASGAWFQRFGSRVAIHGDRLAVGADDNPNVGGGTNVVYVFERDLAGNWSEAAQLFAPQPPPFLDTFGDALDIQGNVVAVGARGEDPGRVYVFERDQGGPGAWGHAYQLFAWQPANGFGNAVALEGDRLLVAAGGLSGSDGRAFVYAREAGSLGPFRPFIGLDPSDAGEEDHFGWSAAFSGDLALVGAPNGAEGTEPQIGGIAGLAFDPISMSLYGVDQRQLILLDPSDGSGSVVGDLGFDEVVGLACDPTTGMLYGSDTLLDLLLRIDPATGEATAVGPTGTSAIVGLAFDPRTNVLYGSDLAADVLVEIDPATGASVVVGPLGFPGVHGLAFDLETNVLYGYDSLSDHLIVIDPLTGAGTSVGATGVTLQAGGLADTAGTLALHASDATDRELLLLDASTGAASLVGLHSSPNNDDPGSAYVFDLSTLGIRYCTSGTSARGCQALLSAAGVPSATAVSGFVLRAAGVEGSRDGLFFFGTNGRQASPWGNGTSYQCVAPPVKRAPILTGSGRVGLCDGTFALDLNAVWCPTCSKPGHNPGAGATAQVQLWYRDPLSTSNQTTSLSDAIEFLVGL